MEVAHPDCVERLGEAGYIGIIIYIGLIYIYKRRGSIGRGRAAGGTGDQGWQAACARGLGQVTLQKDQGTEAGSGTRGLVRAGGCRGGEGGVGGLDGPAGVAGRGGRRR